jgi:formylglycine-generating enzyme required for sulfatase activity
VRRFQREARAAARASHPNVVTVFDIDQAGDKHFLAMEYVEGVTLAQLVKESGPLPVAQACDYVRQAALGLQHAHERGLVHRDIKPANLLVAAVARRREPAVVGAGTPEADAPGAPDVIKILDLGLARLTDVSDSGDTVSALTHTGVVMGTLDFIAPEQVENAHAVDIRADLYSLGCTFYFLLTGRAPFGDATQTMKMIRHLRDEPEPVEQLRLEVPPAVTAIVRRLMAKKPADRYQTPAELAAALMPLCAGEAWPVPALPVAIPVSGQAGTEAFALAGTAVTVPVSVVPQAGDPETAPFPSPSPPPRRRRWFWPATCGAALVVLVLVAAVMLPGGPQTPNNPPPATPLTPALRPVEVTNSLGMKLVLIPPGKFVMGSPPEEQDSKPDERPQHQVSITRPFYLGVHEVTVDNFRAFVNAEGYRTEAERRGYAARWLEPKLFEREAGCSWLNPGFEQGGDHPVVCVSWTDAMLFCDWLSKKEGQTYRLPAEAEWEYACRAGTQTPFFCGATLCSRQTNFDGNFPYAGAPLDVFLQRTTRVGSYTPTDPNPLGLYDMLGNAGEWCADFYGQTFYGDSSPADPTGPVAGRMRVIRGGFWSHQGYRCRAASRNCLYPSNATNWIGFRVARAVGERRP